MAKSKATKREKDAGAGTSSSRVSAGGWAVAEHETSIRAPAARVWRALTEDMGRWWRPDFHALANSRMRLEPVLGGRMYEHADDGSGVVWFTVIGMQPGRSLDLVGHLTAAFGGPAMVLLRFEVIDAGAGTSVRVSESRTGAVSDEGTASAAEGWALLMDQGLKPWVERGE